MSDTDNNRPSADTERANHAQREKLRDGTDESILDTEGKPAEEYAEQEDTYSRDPDSIADRGGETS